MPAWPPLATARLCALPSQAICPVWAAVSGVYQKPTAVVLIYSVAASSPCKPPPPHTATAHLIRDIRIYDTGTASLVYSILGLTNMVTTMRFYPDPAVGQRGYLLYGDSGGCVPQSYYLLLPRQYR